MSKLLLLCLFGLLALSVAIPAPDDQAADDDADKPQTDLAQSSSDEQTEDEPELEDEQDEPEKELSESDDTENDPGFRRRRIRRTISYCYRYYKARRCRRRCYYAYIAIRYGKSVRYGRRCQRFCCDYLRVYKYKCGWCDYWCYYYYGRRRRCFKKCYSYKKYRG